MYEKKISGKRNYQKADYCYYCKHKLLSKVSKHYLAVHTDKLLVQEIISSEGKVRQDLMYKLQQMGNYDHNVKVSQEGTQFYV